MKPGVVVWFTGRPASGKTTLARAVQRKVRGSVLLDSDEVRARLFPSLGYGEEDRGAFYRALGELAALLAAQGVAVLVAATANRRVYRARARRAARRFVEVFVDTPAEECARRDPKGLYRAGVLPGYEAPRRAEVTVRAMTVAQAVRVVLRRVR